MKKKDLMNISLENISDNSDVFTSINLEESCVEASNSFFTNFYNTAVYCFNYAIEVMMSTAVEK